MLEITVFFVLLLAGYFFGKRTERRHFESILVREAELDFLPLCSNGKKEVFDDVSEARLFYGSVVIGQDYFKAVVFAVINIFGGRVRGYETLVERGRRECVLRLKKDAAGWGADEIVNLRYESSAIAINNRNSSGAIELFAYGTAIKH